jgi:hypothetical protein
MALTRKHQQFVAGTHKLKRYQEFLPVLERSRGYVDQLVTLAPGKLGHFSKWKNQHPSLAGQCHHLLGDFRVNAHGR